jgi:hypothetical protein
VTNRLSFRAAFHSPALVKARHLNDMVNVISILLLMVGVDKVHLSVSVHLVLSQISLALLLSLVLVCQLLFVCLLKRASLIRR